MHVKHPFFVLVIVLVHRLVFVYPAFAGDFTAARAKAEQYRAQQKALDDALAQNNVDQVKQHESQAQALLGEAKTLYEEAGMAQSMDTAPIQEYAELLAASSDYDLAAEALQRAVKIDPKNAALWTQLGENLAKVGPSRRKEAFESLHHALELDKSSPAAAKAYFLLGDLYWREGLYEFAQENHQAAFKLNPQDVRTRIAIAALKVRNGQILEASKDLDDLGKAAQPYDAETRMLLRQALADFEAARRWFPDTAENHAASARLLYRAARITDALLAAQRATRLNPKDYATWNFLAAMQIQIGNAPQAKRAYERSLEANPDQPDVRDTITQLDAQAQRSQQPQPPLAPQTPKAPMIVR